ncbi:zinc finger C2HC domain-containing protein 1B isoform X2 [Patella vulgata]|uniref:zinc finger C2HC domain-containing protein 1B isoform X2 n=1 Tax=Patella vulgata TaxID=6465 RepID=UPI0021800B32|nr:zinc finger C2HC domain-containing protein 1B isoform X2 [Patella vulgata]
MDGIQEYDEAGPDERSPCPICGRMFNPRPLQIHKKSCVKSANKPRKVFDSTKQRAMGTDIPLKQMKAAQKKVVPPPKSNWRAQHEDFINTVKSARGVTVAMKTGQALPPPPPPSINPDYVACPYCERRFNQKAAERHIDFCKEQHARKGNKPNAIAKKPPSRIQPPKAAPARTSPSGPAPAASRIPANRAAPASNRTPVASTTTRTPAARNGAPAARGRTVPSYSASDYTDYSSNNGNNIMSPTTGKSLRTGHSPQLDDENNSAKLKKMSYNRTSPLLPQRGGVKGSMTRNPSGSALSSTKRDADFGYYSNNSECDSPFNKAPSSSRISMAAKTTPRVSSAKRNGHMSTLDRKSAPESSPSRFCHDCGTQYPISTAKFCCECGMRRMMISS